MAVLLAMLLAEPAQGKVAFVDSDKILAGFEDAKIARASLDQAVLEWKAELDSMRRAYQEAEAEFKVQQPMLSEEALRARQQELSAMRNRIDDFAQDIWGEGGKVEKEHTELFTPVIEKMNEVIEEKAMEEDVSMVLDVSAGTVLYADISLDLTNQVLEELNREYAALSPTVEEKIAVFGVAPLDEKSQAENLGSRVRQVVVNAVGQLAKEMNLELLNDAEVDQQLSLYGASFERDLDESTALEIGRNLDAKFAYMGTVKKESGNTVVSLRMLRPKDDKAFPPVTATIPEKQEALLESEVSSLVVKLQAYILAGEEEKEEEQIEE